MSAPDRILRQLSDLVGGGSHWRVSDAAIKDSQGRHGRPEHGWVYWDTLVTLMKSRFDPAMTSAILRNEMHQLALYASLPLLTLWRLTKGLYAFEPELQAALIGSEINHLPLNLLQRLPEYAPYIALSGPGQQGIEIAGVPVRGFWVTLAENTDRTRLLQVITLNPDGDLHLYLLQLNGTTLQDTLADTRQTAQQLRQEAFDHRPENSIQVPLPALFSPPSEAFEVALWNTVLTLTFYLCSEEPDLTGVVRGDPQEGKARHQGSRWYVPERSTTLQVGMRYAGAVRMWPQHLGQRAASDTSGLGTPRMPHVRRAHYHLYWSGPGRQEPRVRWLQPTLVNMKGQEMDDYPVSYRPVLPEPQEATLALPPAEEDT